MEILYVFEVFRIDVKMLYASGMATGLVVVVQFVVRVGFRS
jgi:hypothetical protein